MFRVNGEEVHNLTLLGKIVSANDSSTSQVYTIDDPRVEFAVAAQPFLYPGGLTSVWIFLAAILPRGIGDV